MAVVNALEASLAESLGVDVPALWRQTARLRGYAVATVVFEWSKGDGGHEAYLNPPSGYTPPTGPGHLHRRRRGDIEPPTTPGG